MENRALTLLAISTPGERSRRGGSILAEGIHRVGAPWIAGGVALGVAREVVEGGAIIRVQFGVIWVLLKLFFSKNKIYGK